MRTRAILPHALACPSASLCVAVDNYGGVVVSTHPTGGSRAWRRLHIDGQDQFQSVACPSNSFCAAADDSGNVLTSTHPAGGPSAWRRTKVVTQALGSLIAGISCPSVSFCAAVDDRDEALTSSNPRGGSSAWKRTALPKLIGTTGISCASRMFCVAVDGQADVETSTDPLGRTWRGFVVGGSIIGATLQTIACPSRSLCVALNQSASLFQTTTPTRSGSWKLAYLLDAEGHRIDLCGSVDYCAGMSAIACPSPKRCLAADGRGEIVFGVRRRR